MKSIESHIRRVGFAATAAVLLLCADISRADEGGVSFGQYASLVAAPQVPGWALGVIYYHSNVSAFGNVAAARQITVGRIPANVNVNLNLSLSGQGDPVILSPTYTFATPVLGGQLSVGGELVRQGFCEHRRDIDGGGRADRRDAQWSFAGFADLLWRRRADRDTALEPGRQQLHGLYHRRHSRWRLQFNAVGQSRHRPRRGRRLHVFNPATGNEFSATAGFIYNFKNPDTQYRNGIDFHFDWGAAHFVSKQVFIGVAGYAYQQITDDSGQNPILGGFRSRVLGIGPQIGYAFPLGDMQGFLGLRGYGDFDAANRAPGWSTWLTFAISPAEPTAAKPTRRLLTK